ncbi:Vacuolar protein sorting-associated protein vps5 [Tilletia horrida]|nr:Vacuolar protein sorting-associated protein vps5 [Tilletia horrida]
MVKVIVTGASGLLGRAVLARCKAEGFEGLAFSRASGDTERLDLTDTAATEALVRAFAPHAIIHTAAERRPDVVENDPQASHALNVDVPAHLARLCASLSDPVPVLINISTDYVFDGTSPPYSVRDAPHPLNAYGQSKLDGEHAVHTHGRPGRATSLRVPVLYGRTAPISQHDESAVNVLLDAIRPATGAEKKKKKMDAYAIRYPTNVEDVARVLADLVKHSTSTPSSPSSAPPALPPLLHFSAAEAMTKYDMALTFARLTTELGGQAETTHLEPEYEVDPNAATSRPHHCQLDVSELAKLGISTDCIPFEQWWRPYLSDLLNG